MAFVLQLPGNYKMLNISTAAVNQATQDVTSKYEEEQEKVKRSKEEVEEKLESLRAKVSNEKYVMLAVLIILSMLYSIELYGKKIVYNVLN